jgi:hypothetical protein
MPWARVLRSGQVTFLKEVRESLIELERFDELYKAVKTQKSGHVSGVTDRQGRDFLTVYFSERGSSRR